MWYYMEELPTTARWLILKPNLSEPKGAGSTKLDNFQVNGNAAARNLTEQCTAQIVVSSTN